MIINDRSMIIQSVLEGKLPPEYITEDELEDVQLELMNQIIMKKASEGKIAFSGFVKSIIH